MLAKDAVGEYGERLAARFLEDSGWVVLDRNWRGTGGELDVVALDGETLVVVEVKTRRGTAYGHPAQGVTPAKLARVRRLAGEWMTAHLSLEGAPYVRDVRIDVVAVVLPQAGAAEIEHLAGVW
ncbi:YraN family protein [Cellulomonas sp. PhB143]|uniref:YraN family protein n=1 Tax=Cellulomonas sp. PhB143 TaxID=2485186 RepID=UPI000F466E93|nr:YraN family protein [Cellulomonas sp. PhB143]ROS77121.1 putative endonuclease [Cellulomonas sp. PhB143]